MLGKSEFSDSKPVGSNKEKETKPMTKTRQETDTARDTQYNIGHAPKRILIRATVAN